MSAESDALNATDRAVRRAAEEASLTGMSPIARLDELNHRAEDPNLWNDAAAAQKLMRERNQLPPASKVSASSNPRSPTRWN